MGVIKRKENMEKQWCPLTRLASINGPSNRMAGGLIGKSSCCITDNCAMWLERDIKYSGGEVWGSCGLWRE